MNAPITLQLDIRAEHIKQTQQFQQHIPLQGIIGVFGRSGAGKTSLLRALSGLDRHFYGKINLAQQVLQDTEQQVFVPADQRAIGMVFDKARLFPHLSVHDNLRFARAHGRKPPQKNSLQHQSESRWNTLTDADLIQLTGIAELLERMPLQLSAGEQQRVALARALFARPRLLLLDEPLSQLDQQARRSLLNLMLNIQQQTGLPMLYVSHQIEEIQYLADQLLLIEQGKIQAFGPVHQLLNHTGALTRPASLPLLTSLALKICEHLPHGLIRLRLATKGSTALKQTNAAAANSSELDVFMTSPAHAQINTHAWQPGQHLRCTIRASEISISLQRPQGSSIVNMLPVRITQLVALDQAAVWVQVNTIEHSPDHRPQVFNVQISAYSAHHLQLQPQQAVYIQFKAGALRTIS